MIYKTGGFTKAALHFVIQNISSSDQPLPYSWLPIVESILYRGAPTKPSPKIKAVLDKLEGSLDQNIPLISDTEPVWQYRIKGHAESNSFPARIFFSELIKKYLPDYSFITKLMYPECPISEILAPDSNIDIPFDESVDFYLPQAKLIIEIDGSQHRNIIQSKKDSSRDLLFSNAEIATLRVSANSIFKEDEELTKFFDVLRNIFQNDRAIKPIACNLNRISSGSINPKTIVAASIFRFQSLIIELLKVGKLSLQENWNFSIQSEVDIKYLESAANDILDLIEILSKLTGENIERPSVHVGNPKEAYKNGQSIKIDLGVSSRWSEEADKNPDTIFVRTHYCNRLYQKKKYKDIDKFELGKVSQVTFNLKESGSENDDNVLTSLLKYVFGYDSFNPGQISIIRNLLLGRDTIGILPTGGGKSICYQFPALLSPGITVVICPITALIRDQVDELHSIGVGRAAYITSEIEVSEKEEKLSDFSKGKLKFIVVSPERFQKSEFRDCLVNLANQGRISQFVIDEAHCLSEWGHDFRTSYLTLSDTIRACCPNVRICCLTATASFRVLKDIKIEFGIEEDDVCYLPDFSRNELRFEVLKDENRKKDALERLLSRLNAEGRIGLESPGIVFTSRVNGFDGCAQLSQEYGDRLGEVAYYSGGKPNGYAGTDQDYNKHKIDTQLKFKNNELRLLFATKSFGMGVNKKNIRFTIHYGMPVSMEALYQEAGRAGRDRQSSTCFTLFTPEKIISDIQAIGDENLDMEALDKIVQQRKQKGDLVSQLYFIVQSAKPVKDEIASIVKVEQHLRAKAGHQSEIDKSNFSQSKDVIEKSLFRLKQLGLVATWTVEDFFRGIYLVDYKNVSNAKISENLITLFKRHGRYDEEVNRLKAMTAETEEAREELYEILIKWNQRNFVYNRRQSLKTLYEACDSFHLDGAEKFKRRLEDYFKVDGTTKNLQTFVEYDYKSWPEVIDFFFVSKGLPKGESFLERLKNTLPRFLESYNDNPCLNLISAISKLLDGDFLNSDGIGRFKSFLSRLDANSNEPLEFIEQLSFLVSSISSSEIELVSAEICETFTSPAVRKYLHTTLQDNASLAYCMGDYLGSLKNISRRLEYGIK